MTWYRRFLEGRRDAVDNSLIEEKTLDDELVTLAENHITVIVEESEENSESVTRSHEG